MIIWTAPMEYFMQIRACMCVCVCVAIFGNYFAVRRNVYYTVVAQFL